MLENVKNTGDKYEVVDVAPGFAQNFLFPKGLAQKAIPSNLKKLENKKKKWQERAEEEKKELQKEVEGLRGKEIAIEEKANKEGSLFGSLARRDVEERLRKDGHDISKGEVVLEEPIKKVGEYEVLIRFPYGLEAKIKVVVSEEKEG